MTINQSSLYIFRHIALQNPAIAENLAKIAERSRATKQYTGSVFAEKETVASSPLLFREPRHRDFAEFRCKQISYHMSVTLPFLGLLILIAGLVAIGFVVGPTLYILLVASVLSLTLLYI